MTKLTIKEVAKAAGVSTATISRVLNENGYVSEEARRRVLETIERLHYKPNTIARSLKQDRSGGIGFVLPDLTNPYFMRIARALHNRLAGEGYYVFFMDSDEEPEKEREALNFLLEKRVEAILLAGTGGNLELIRRIQAGGTPLVLLDRQLPGVPADAVMEDNETAAEEAVMYLLDKGHRTVGVLNGPAGISTAAERARGALKALTVRGMEAHTEYSYYGDYTRNSGKRAAKYFLELPVPPTAVFSANNEMTFGFLLGLKENGLPIDHMELVSFGGLDFASLFRHRLTAIRQEPDAVAEAAAELLLRRIREPESAGKREKRLLVPRLEVSPASEDG
ncbi:LacI family DNA-binding transcriptional regulator [Paenibacillus chartarius]|uniref:LacI family DNA-binding transcriptional regulator n=1 Tax=Paenibacillus chartarius TaxID=747481 RepID=A0ABV6DK05_9BACL